MVRIIEITPVTLKRLQNYRRVFDNEMEKAQKLQWMEMTLERMQAFETARERAEQVGAVATYAGFLFRVRTGAMAYRELYGEPLLANALVELLRELGIAVNMVCLDAGEPVFVNPN